MITYGNIYIIAKNFDKCIEFYKKLFEKDVDAQNKTRYAIFTINGLGLSVMNGNFDSEHPDEVIQRGQYCDLFDDTKNIAKSENSRKVVINLCTDDLKKEHDRIKNEDIGTDLTEIRYINARNPYYYFSLLDPEGNIVEITGDYDGEILE